MSQQPLEKERGQVHLSYPLSVSAGSPGMHQCYQPQTDVPAVPRLT